MSSPHKLQSSSDKKTYLYLTWCSKTWKQKNLMWSSLGKKENKQNMNWEKQKDKILMNKIV